MKSIFILFVVLSSSVNVFSDERIFQSIKELRKEFGEPDYGPDFNDVVSEYYQNIIFESKIIVCVNILGLSANEGVPASLLSLSGHELGSLQKVFTIDGKSGGLPKLLLNYNLIGDKYMTLFKPNYAFEIASNNDSVVLLYDDNTGMCRYSQSKWKGEFTTWRGERFTTHKSVIDLLNVYIAETKKSEKQ